VPLPASSSGIRPVTDRYRRAAEGDGIKFPTERRVYVAGPDCKPMPDLMTVSVDLSNYRFV